MDNESYYETTYNKYTIDNEIKRIAVILLIIVALAFVSVAYDNAQAAKYSITAAVIKNKISAGHIFKVELEIKSKGGSEYTTLRVSQYDYNRYNIGETVMYNTEGNSIVHNDTRTREYPYSIK